MSIKNYLKNQKLWMISNTLVLIIISSILFSTQSDNRHLNDIIYMDLLIIIINIFTIYLGYMKDKKKYKNINTSSIETLNKKSAATGDYFIDLLLDTSRKQQNKFLELEEEYKKGINEIQDYTTQWVHDVKVNIAVCDLLLEEMEVENSKDFRNQVEQIKFRVNQILHVTRANHYDKDLVAGEVDVHHLLRSAIKENALFFINKNIEIHTDLAPFNVISDKRWVFYIFCQILNNSSKYTPKDGTLKISTKEDDYAYYVIIKDDGIGIPKEDISRIFDKGFTGENGKIGTKSTGMGLYYANKIAGNLSIKINVQSEVGEYTEFSIAFYKLSDYYQVSSISP